MALAILALIAFYICLTFGVIFMIRARKQAALDREEVEVEYRLRRENERLLRLARLEEEDELNDKVEEPPLPPVPPRPPAYLSRQKLIPIKQTPSEGNIYIILKIVL
jgi:hypothetical protein